MLNILTWNVRGAGDRIFPFLIRDLKARHHVDILVVVETRISGQKANKVMEKLGFPCYDFVHAEGFSGGIWVL